MALFDSIVCSQDLDLRTCPYNEHHKIKDSRYARHVARCALINESVKKSLLEQKSNMAQVKADMELPEKQIDADVDDVVEQLIIEPLPSIRPLKIKSKDNFKTSEPGDNWDDQKASNYSLFRHKEADSEVVKKDLAAGNGLNDDDIMKLAESFTDIALYTRMEKENKKKLNSKLAEMASMRQERKMKAFKELLAMDNIIYGDKDYNNIRWPRKKFVFDSNQKGFDSMLNKLSSKRQ